MAQYTTIVKDSSGNVQGSALVLPTGSQVDYAGGDKIVLPDQTVTAYLAYRNNAGTWEAGDPDTAACETCELFLSLGTDVGDDGMLAEGVVTYGSWAWSVIGAPLYLDDAGALTETVPSSPSDDGRVGRIVGWVRAATSIRFDGHVPGVTFEAAGS